MELSFLILRKIKDIFLFEKLDIFSIKYRKKKDKILQFKTFEVSYFFFREIL